MCLSEGTLVAVEVKTRRSAEYGLPEEAVTPAKLAHIAAALEQLQLRDLAGMVDWRIDGVVMTLVPAGGHWPSACYKAPACRDLFGGPAWGPPTPGHATTRVPA